MNFDLTQDQQALVSSARSFAKKSLGVGPTDSREPDNAFSQYKSRWDICSKAGYAGLVLPKTVGGRGLSLVDSMLIFEAMADEGVDPGFLFSLGVHQFAAGVSIFEAGSAQQRETWLPKMSAGSCIGALAISERESGADSYSMSASADETPHGFTISGEKVWISNAPVADVFLVCARTDDLPGAFGISCFLVPGAAEGVCITNGPTKAGLKGAPWGTVTLDNVKVSADSMLGGRGGGAAVFQESMRWERCGLFAVALGAMSRNFADCLAHVRERQQFGQALIDNDIVAKTISLKKTRMESARLLLFKAASSIDDRKPDDALVSLAKAAVSEAAIANALAGQELFGAKGVLESSGANQFLNDMLPFRSLSGPNDIQYKIASRLLARALG